jgi:hypothetical protein
MGETSSASPFGIPVYQFKTLIPIAGVLLFVQGIAETLRCVMCIRDGKWPSRFADVEEIEKQAIEGHLDPEIAAMISTNGTAEDQREGGR